ncbi:MAG: formylglycine-generating enzyme family protein [Magnetococcales bacterium]|nr:formylglycine-generating enzyme family protein [Magnetococcales bacterium]
MSMLRETPSLDSLLTGLRHGGLDIGIQETLRIHAVFQKIAQSESDAPTIAQIKAILSSILVRSDEKRKLFNRLFDQWLDNITLNNKSKLFPTTDHPSGTPDQQHATRSFDTNSPIQKKSFITWERVLWLLLAYSLFLIIIVFAAIIPEQIEFTPSPPRPLMQDEIFQKSNQDFKQLLKLTDETSIKDPSNNAPPTVIRTINHPYPAIAASAFIILILMFLFPLRRRLLQPSEPLLFNEGATEPYLPAWESKELIFLDHTNEELIVWGIDTFTAEEATQTIDIDATVEKTAQDGGLLNLVFQPARYHRTVWILLDKACQSPTLERLAQEVETALLRANLPVETAFFWIKPDQFTDNAQARFILSDLEEQRNGLIMLLLTDGELLSAQYQRSDRNSVRFNAILRMLSSFPRLWFVTDLTDSRALKTVIEPFQLALITADQLPAVLGQSRTQPARIEDKNVIKLWAATCALSPLPVLESQALALHKELKISCPSSHYRHLFHYAKSSTDAVIFTDTQRQELLDWLSFYQQVDPSDTLHEDTVLNKALNYWLTAFERQIRKTEESPEKNSLAYHRLTVEQVLLTLWLAPEKAIPALFTLFDQEPSNKSDQLRELIKKRIKPYSDQHATSSDLIRLPWQLDDRTDAEKAMLLTMGFGGDPGVNYSTKSPGRVWFSIGITLWLAISGGYFIFYDTYLWTSLFCPHSEYKDNNGIPFIRLCAGSFKMGSPENEKGRNSNEGPVHKVTLSAFDMAKYETTNAQYRLVHPDHKGEDDLPVINVSWNDADGYCRSLGYRLPTEAEWEYATRAGTQSRWSFGEDESQLDQYANYNKQNSDSLLTVGSMRPNPWGLYDLHGNAWEWNSDWYDTYPAKEQTNPTGPKTGLRRVIRGGSFLAGSGYLRSADRDWYEPGDRFRFLGFRCVRGASPASLDS